MYVRANSITINGSHLLLNGLPRKVHDKIRLVGSYINVAAEPASAALNVADTADARVKRAIARWGL